MGLASPCLSAPRRIETQGDAIGSLAHATARYVAGLRRSASRLFLATWVATFVACGAGDAPAPYTAPPPQCLTIDNYLVDLYAVVDDGGVEALASTIRDRIPDSVRRDLLDGILRLLSSFEEGSFTSLADELDKPEHGPGLQQTLGLIVRYLANGQSGPDLAFIGVLQSAVATCEGGPVFGLLADLTRDEALLPALLSVLSSDTLATLLEDLDFEGEGGRLAFQLLIRNLLVSASSPTFDLDGIIALLQVVLGDSLNEPPYDQLVAGLRRVFVEGDGLVRLQTTLVCLRTVDPDLALGGFLYDLVTSGLLSDLAGSNALGITISPAILELATSALDFLATDSVSRRALQSTLIMLLDPTIAPPVLGDVATLLEREALGGVIDLVVAVASGECKVSAPEPSP